MQHFGLDQLHPQADLAVMLRETKWLAASMGTAHTSPDDQRRWLRAFFLFEQTKRVAYTLSWARRISGSDEKVKWVRKRIDRMVTQSEQAQDHLFELELAARLARHLDLRVTLAEPDILVGMSFPADDGELIERTFALACKRPRRIRSAGPAIAEAAAQLQRHAACVEGYLPSFVVIGTEAMLHRLETPEEAAAMGRAAANRMPISYITKDPLTLGPFADRLTQQIIGGVANDIAASFKRGVVAVLFCGVITAFRRNPPSYHWRWTHAVRPNPEMWFSQVAADFLRSRLFQ